MIITKWLHIIVSKPRKSLGFHMRTHASIHALVEDCRNNIFSMDISSIDHQFKSGSMIHRGRKSILYFWMGSNTQHALWPSDTIWCSMAWCRTGNKPLPTTMLTKFLDAIWCHQGPMFWSSWVWGNVTNHTPYSSISVKNCVLLQIYMADMCKKIWQQGWIPLSTLLHYIIFVPR